MARRANCAIAKRKAETAAKLAQLDANATEDARITRTKKQLALLDDLIDTALAQNKPALFLKLAASKSTLWGLVSPRVAPKKPGRDERRQRPLPVPMDVGNWTPAPVVVPPSPVPVSTPLARPAPAMSAPVVPVPAVPEPAPPAPARALAPPVPPPSVPAAPKSQPLVLSESPLSAPPPSLIFGGGR